MTFTHVHEEDFMEVIIGIDPHKATHMAVAIDGDEHAIGRLEVTADRCQTDRLLAWAAHPPAFFAETGCRAPPPPPRPAFREVTQPRAQRCFFLVGHRHREPLRGRA